MQKYSTLVVPNIDSQAGSKKSIPSLATTFDLNPTPPVKLHPDDRNRILREAVAKEKEREMNWKNRMTKRVKPINIQAKSEMKPRTAKQIRRLKKVVSLERVRNTLKKHTS